MHWRFFPNQWERKWIAVTLSYHINMVLHQSFSYRLLSSNDTKIRVKKLMWLRNLSVEETVIVSSVVTDVLNSFVLSSLKPPLWRSYPKGMNGCSLQFCSVWCGCIDCCMEMSLCDLFLPVPFLWIFQLMFARGQSTVKSYMRYLNNNSQVLLYTFCPPLLVPPALNWVICVTSQFIYYLL